MGVTEVLCTFKVVLEGKTCKEIPESSRLEFLEKFSASFWEVMDSFVLLAYASLEASRTL